MISLSPELHQKYVEQIPQMTPLEIIHLISEHSFVQDHKLLAHLTPEQKNNRELFEHLVEIDVTSIYYADDALKNDDHLVKRTICANPFIIIPEYFAWPNMINQRYHSDKEFIFLAIEARASVYAKLSTELQLDKDIALFAIQRGLYYSSLLPYKSLKYDMAIVKAAIDKDPDSIRAFPAQLKANAEIVNYAYKKKPTILKFASTNFFVRVDGICEPAGELRALIEKEMLSQFGQTLDVQECVKTKPKL